MSDLDPTIDALRPLDGLPHTNTLPTYDDLKEIRRYCVEYQEALKEQIAEVERAIGFLANTDELAVRVAKIEAFLGIKA